MAFYNISFGKRSLILILYLFISISSFSQTDSIKNYNFNGVVITATRTQTPSIEVASSISVISQEDIQNSKKNFLFDLLKGEPGISFNQQGGVGKFASVYIRGGNPGHTLVLMDGIEINMPNDPAGSLDFSTLPLDDVERIEILRGPQSTLYGSDALAGVINIISKKGAGKPKFFLNGEGGSYNSFKGGAGLSGGYNIFNYSLSLTRVTTDGFSSASEKYGNTEKDGHSGFNISSRVGADISKNLSVGLIYKYNKAKTDYDQFGGMFGDDPTYIFNLEENAFRTEATGNFMNGFWESKAGVSYFKNTRKYSYDSIATSPSSSKSFYDGSKVKIDWQNNLRFSANNILTLGLETEKEKAYTEFFIYSSTFPFESILPDNTTKTTGIFLQGQFKASDGFFGSAGVRFDDHSRFGSSVTYRIAPAYIFWETGTKIKATYGTGFKAPSLFYLFDPGYGNTELKPEKSTGWDVGAEQYFFSTRGNDESLNSNLIIGATYFSNTYKDLFGIDASFKTINVDKAETKGLEIYLSAIPADKFLVKANYTLTKTKDLSPGSDGETLIRRPENKAALNLNYRIADPLNANVEVIYVGEREDNDFSQFPAVRVKLKSYTLINLAASYDLFQYLQLYGKIENLLDSNYEEVLGYGVAGLSFYGGIKLNL